MWKSWTILAGGFILLALLMAPSFKDIGALQEGAGPDIGALESEDAGAVTATPTPTATNTPVNTPTSTHTPIDTSTSTATATNTVPTPTSTSTHTPVNTSTSTHTPIDTSTPTHTPGIPSYIREGLTHGSGDDDVSFGEWYVWWDDVDNESGYEIQRRYLGGGWEIVTPTPGSADGGTYWQFREGNLAPDYGLYEYSVAALQTDLTPVATIQSDGILFTTPTPTITSTPTITDTPTATSTQTPTSTPVLARPLVFGGMADGLIGGSLVQ